MIKVYTDGACLGNPGKVGVGYVIYKDSKVIKQGSVPLGVGTNNFAEYMACIFSLVDILAMGERQCHVFSDSKLICEQIKGNFKVKNQNIFPLYTLARRLADKFDDFKITHIGRELNQDADILAKKAAGLVV